MGGGCSGCSRPCLRAGAGTVSVPGYRSKKPGAEYAAVAQVLNEEAGAAEVEGDKEGGKSSTAAVATAVGSTPPPKPVNGGSEDASAASTVLRLEHWVSASGARTLCSATGADYGHFAFACTDAGAVPGAAKLSPRAEASIRNDVNRTSFAGGGPLRPESTKALERLLRALAAWDPEVSYCQGMNFITAFTLLTATNGASGPSKEQEEDIFWFIACLMKHYGGRYMFLDRTPLLKLYSFCMSRLLQQRLPEVHRFLDGLDAILGHKWFGTFFTALLPLEVTARAWDLLVAEGLQTLLFLAVAVCSLLAPELAAAESRGEEAVEVLGRLQKQMPMNAALLLPPGWAPVPNLPGSSGGEPAGFVEGAAADSGEPAHRTVRAAAERLVEATRDQAQLCGIDELETLAEAWRKERPDEAADLTTDFSFARRYI